MSDAERLLVLFDGECRLCRTSARIAQRLDRNGRLDLVAGAGADALVARGRAGSGDRTGIAAVAAVVGAFPAPGPPLARLLRFSAPLGSAVYRAVSRHRRLLG